MNLEKNKNYTDEFKKQTAAKFCSYVNKRIEEAAYNYHKQNGMPEDETKKLLSEIESDDIIFNDK